MKLSDLLETNWKSVARNGDLPDNLQARRDELEAWGDATPLGHGANSFVYQNDNDHRELNSVRRVSSSRARHDLAYHLYAEYLQKNPRLRNNPYLPRIEAVEDDSATETREYKIERLVPFDSPKVGHDETLWAACNRMFTKQIVEDIKEQIEEDKVRYPYVKPESHIFGVIARTISSCVGMDTKFTQRAIEGGIKDPQLAEAIRVVQNILSTGPGLQKDMHPGNFMWRITGTMPQLVLTDPLYQLDSDSPRVSGPTRY